MCLLQPAGYPKRDEREPVPYCVDVQADLSLLWSHRSYCRFCRVLMGRFILCPGQLAPHPGVKLPLGSLPSPRGEDTPGILPPSRAACPPPLQSPPLPHTHLRGWIPWLGQLLAPAPIKPDRSKCRKILFFINKNLIIEACLLLPFCVFTERC